MTAKVVIECKDCRLIHSRGDKCPHLFIYQERIQRGTNLFREMFKCEAMHDDEKDELCTKNLYANCPFRAKTKE